MIPALLLTFFVVFTTNCGKSSYSFSLLKSTFYERVQQLGIPVQCQMLSESPEMHLSGCVMTVKPMARGRYPVTAVFSAGEGRLSEYRFVLAIESEPFTAELISLAPLQNYALNLKVRQGEAVTYLLPSSTQASLVFYSCSGLPRGLSLNSFNGVISGVVTKQSGPRTKCKVKDLEKGEKILYLVWKIEPMAQPQKVRSHKGDALKQYDHKIKSLLRKRQQLILQSQRYELISRNLDIAVSYNQEKQKERSLNLKQIEEAEGNISAVIDSKIGPPNLERVRRIIDQIAEQHNQLREVKDRTQDLVKEAKEWLSWHSFPCDYTYSSTLDYGSSLELVTGRKSNYQSYNYFTSFGSPRYT